MEWEEDRAILINTIKSNDFDFEEIAMRIYSFQYQYNPVYQRYARLIKKSPDEVKELSDIPFLPIRFFKELDVQTGHFIPECVFQSSGTSQKTKSRHMIRDLSWYSWVSKSCFDEAFYPKKYTDFQHLGFLPSYASNAQSSLLEMVQSFIRDSGGGFFHQHPMKLKKYVEENPTKMHLIWGVSYALFHWGEDVLWADHCKVIETGGMKGKEKEITREELHSKIKSNFGLEAVSSEYGMTELLSQCYALKDGIFRPSRTMKVIPRKINDPLSTEDFQLTAALNIIDLANLDSCAFIATDDIGKVEKDGTFSVLGRLDQSDIRGCNLLVSP